jgi:hypothetical protein
MGATVIRKTADNYKVIYQEQHHGDSHIGNIGQYGHACPAQGR